MEIKKVLITGGAGFIGSHVTDKFLNLGYQVVVLDNLTISNKLSLEAQKKVEFINGDIRDPKIVDSAVAGCQIIIHLAAIVGVDEVIKNPKDMLETETLGTINVANSALTHGVRKIVYSSSSAVYHKLFEAKSKEEDELGLINSYAVAKRLNEQYLEAIAKHSTISTNSVRLFNVYGTRQDSRMVIPKFFQAANANRPLEVFGCGGQTRDFTHISEVCEGIAALAKNQKINGIFNISRGVETTISELAISIKKIVGSTSEIIHQEFPYSRLAYRVDRRIGSNSKLHRHTGIKPSINLMDGLNRCFEQTKVAQGGF